MLGYLIFSRPFHGLKLTFARRSPAMNRWAILIRPLTWTGLEYLFGQSQQASSTDFDFMV
jgi:hypothetical protein